MFKKLYSCPSNRARHENGPFAEDRERFLAYCAQHGYTEKTLRGNGYTLLEVARELDASPGRTMTERQIKKAADCWVLRKYWRTGKRRSGKARAEFINIAVCWFRFLGRFIEPLKEQPLLFSELLRDFVVWMEDERGLSRWTILYRGKAIRRFLRWYATLNRPFSEVRLVDIDAFLAKFSERGWSRSTIANEAGMLRPFFRYAGIRGWCPVEIADGIKGPRVYAEEGLPIGPSWEDVKRLLSSVETDNPYHIRDRAIFLLCGIYGLRLGEVIGLRVEDIDWEHDRLRVRRHKLNKVQTYPLVPWVGNAILRYLMDVRPKCERREVFLTSRAPVRPLSRACIYQAVSSRMLALGIQSVRYGPHALRHSCATHLASQGLSFKLIGDHLGHSSANSTRVYAKVNLPMLREVAELDLGGLL